MASYGLSPCRRDGFSARHAGASGAMIRAVPPRNALKASTRSDSVLGRRVVVQTDTCFRTRGSDDAGVDHGKPEGKDGEEYLAGSTSST